MHADPDVNNYINFAYKVASNVASGTQRIEDAKQIAVLSLMKAIKGYVKRRPNCALTTYAYPRIRRDILLSPEFTSNLIPTDAQTLTELADVPVMTDLAEAKVTLRWLEKRRCRSLEGQLLKRSRGNYRINYDHWSVILEGVSRGYTSGDMGRMLGMTSSNVRAVQNTILRKYREVI